MLVLSNSARRTLAAGICEQLRKQLGAPTGKLRKKVVHFTQPIEAEVFLRMFRDTTAYNGVNFMSLVGLKHISRNVSFSEMDAVLSHASSRPGDLTSVWHVRTHALGHRAYIDQSKPGRLSIRLVNTVTSIHDDCPRCNYTGLSLFGM